jgi:hypothetical protein
VIGGFDPMILRRVLQENRYSPTLKNQGSAKSRRGRQNTIAYRIIEAAKA